jgi:hypothetical protein
MASQRRAGPSEGPPSIPAGKDASGRGIVDFVSPQRAVGQLSMDRIDEARHLRLALMSRGFETSASGHIIEISNCSSSDVLTTLWEIAGSPLLPEKIWRNTLLNFIVKNNDHFLPDERLKAALVFRQ